MLSDHLQLRRLAERFHGLRRPIRGEMAVFFEHVTAARNFTVEAREAGYETDLFGSGAYVYRWNKCH